jgi:predicted DNA-binding protein
MSDVKVSTLTILLPGHTEKKLEALSKHYRMPKDMIVQKIVVDRVDDLNEAVLLEPARKGKA